MRAKITVEYFQLLDHWSWEVTVNDHSVYGIESTYENAIGCAKDALEDLLESEES